MKILNDELLLVYDRVDKFFNYNLVVNYTTPKDLSLTDGNYILNLYDITYFVDGIKSMSESFLSSIFAGHYLPNTSLVFKTTISKNYFLYYEFPHSLSIIDNTFMRIYQYGINSKLKNIGKKLKKLENEYWSTHNE